MPVDIDLKNIKFEMELDLINLFLKPKFNEVLPSIPKYITSFIKKHFRNLDRTEINFTEDELKNLDNINLYLTSLIPDLKSAKNNFEQKRNFEQKKRVATYFDNILYKLEFVVAEIKRVKGIAQEIDRMQKEFSKLHNLLSDGVVVAEKNEEYVKRINKSQINDELKKQLVQIIKNAGDDEDSLIVALKTVVERLKVSYSVEEVIIKAAAAPKADDLEKFFREEYDTSIALFLSIYKDVATKEAIKEIIPYESFQEGDCKGQQGLFIENLCLIFDQKYGKYTDYLKSLQASEARKTSKTGPEGVDLSLIERIEIALFPNSSATSAGQGAANSDPSISYSTLLSENEEVFEKWFISCAKANRFEDPKEFFNRLKSSGLDFVIYAMSDSGIDDYYKNNPQEHSQERERKLTTLRALTKSELSISGFEKNELMPLFKEHKCASLDHLINQIQAQKKIADKLSEERQRQALEANARKEKEENERAEMVENVFATYLGSEFFKDIKNQDFRGQIVAGAMLEITRKEFYEQNYHTRNPDEFKRFLLLRNPDLEPFFEKQEEQEYLSDFDDGMDSGDEMEIDGTEEDDRSSEESELGDNESVDGVKRSGRKRKREEEEKGSLREEDVSNADALEGANGLGRPCAASLKKVSKKAKYEI